MKSFDDYRDIVGDKSIDSLYDKAAEFSEKHFVHINSTFSGGGVAEILENITVLMNEAGVKTGWRLLKGKPDFFHVTKRFHNALQGGSIEMTEMKKIIYEEGNKWNGMTMHLENHDLVIVHDPQPLALIRYSRKKQPWLWRCHIDVTEPNRKLVTYLKNFTALYDGAIFSSKEYLNNMGTSGLKRFVIHPSIDPLSAKNEELSETKQVRFLNRFGIDMEKPIITQVSRFDKFKDQLGLINIFNKVSEKVDCKLVLAGNMATDDPEGPDYFKRVHDVAAENPNIQLMVGANDVTINALQRKADVVVQKSLREGFGLTVTEAMWKGRPVVGSKVGGIPIQIRHEETGFVAQNNKDFIGYLVKLLKDRKLGEKMGGKAREWVRKKFLITRHVGDYFRVYSKFV